MQLSSKIIKNQLLRTIYCDSWIYWYLASSTWAWAVSTKSHLTQNHYSKSHDGKEKDAFHAVRYKMQNVNTSSSTWFAWVVMGQLGLHLQVMSCEFLPSRGLTFHAITKVVVKLYRLLTNSVLNVVFSSSVWWICSSLLRIHALLFALFPLLCVQESGRFNIIDIPLFEEDLHLYTIKNHSSQSWIIHLNSTIGQAIK